MPDADYLSRDPRQRKDAPELRVALTVGGVGVMAWLVVVVYMHALFRFVVPQLQSAYDEAGAETTGVAGSLVSIIDSYNRNLPLSWLTLAGVWLVLVLLLCLAAYPLVLRADARTGGNYLLKSRVAWTIVGSPTVLLMLVITLAALVPLVTFMRGLAEGV